MYDDASRPYMFGDLGRTMLKARGIDLSLTVVDEAVTNLSGGTGSGWANAGQAAFQAKFDLAKLAGIKGGTFGITLVDRWGTNLAAEQGIPTFQLLNEVFGRGNILRLTEFYYQQKLFNDAIEVKAGRLPVGSDFFFGSCDYLNLTFCGGTPGNLYGNYIFNWPISQWGGVVKANLSRDLQLRVGFYDANPNYLSTDPDIALLPSVPGSHPDAGLLVPVELVWSGKSRGLSGTYRIGGWYNDATADDAVTSTNGQPAIISGLPLLRDTGRYGYYLSITQQLTQTPGSLNPDGGLHTFFNATFGDRRTSFLDYQVAWGMRQVGTFASRPFDEIGFAIGVTHVNSRVSDAQAEANALGVGPGFVQDAEIPIELWYGWQATGWLNLKFDAQYIISPGGYSSPTNEDAAVLGVRSTVKF
jgi:porin